MGKARTMNILAVVVVSAVEVARQGL